MSRTRRQRGGALEPTRKVPAFKYTEDPERRKIIELLYPYSSYFASIWKEIPWSEFRSTHEGFSATCNDIPYFIYGGAAYEAYSQLFPNVTPHLHDLVDPTADIDVYITPLFITNNSHNNTRYYPYIIHTNSNLNSNSNENNNSIEDTCKDENDIPIIKYSPIYDDYTNWLSHNIATKIKSISYNFPFWFDVSEHKLPTEEFINIYHPDACQIDIIEIHPVYVVRKLAKNGIKIYIYLYDGSDAYEFMECAFWSGNALNDTNPLQARYNDPNDTIIKTNDGLFLNSFGFELELHKNAIDARLELLADMYKEGRHKILNHIYRILYLLGLYNEKLNTVTGENSKMRHRISSFLRMFLFILKNPKIPNMVYSMEIKLLPSIKQTINELSILQQTVDIICNNKNVLNILLDTDGIKVDSILQEYGCPINTTKKIRVGGYRRYTHRQRRHVRKTQRAKKHNRP